MTSLTGDLPDNTFQFLAEQASSQGFRTPAEYLAALAKEAEATREGIEEELAKGLESGPPRPMTRQDWDDLKQRVWKRNESERRS